MFSLYSLHKDAEESNNSHFKLYIDWVTRFNAKYAFKDFSTYSEGPISEAIWQNVKLSELANAFNPVVASKKNHYPLNSL